MINDTLQKKDDTALKALGISEEVLAFAGPILDSLKERFQKIDDLAEYNQLRIIKAFQDAHIGEASLKGTTGYGYDDIGRDGLEKVYSLYFHTEDALVRPQITCGTHALALALMSTAADHLRNACARPRTYEQPPARTDPDEHRRQTV